MRFYPDNAHVPAGLDTTEFILRPLGPEHVERDYDAFMSSRERLLLWSGGSWPAADFTLDQNMDDMHMHRGEHDRREAFTYTVMTPDETSCLGCVYINPPGPNLTNLGVPEAAIAGHFTDDDAAVTFWVRDSAYAQDMDTRLLAALRDWFTRDWAFGRVFWQTTSDDQRACEILEAAGLQRLHEYRSEPRSLTFYLYG